jgi:hypothetical protein
VNWPVGRGRDFVGTIAVEGGGVRLVEGDAGKAGTLREMSIDDVAALNPNLDAAAIKGEIELVRDACKKFDLQAFREGHLSPVFFGSALKNFGVGDLLDAIGRIAPPPRAQKADKRTVEADEQNLTAFVFKIQANMDPNHRDRIAFARLCSGKLTRGMKVRQVRTGKSISLNAPQFFFAQDRALAEEAYAGDVVGIPNHGAISIGDTLTEGEELNFLGVPNFAPEILRRVRLPDAMKAKKLKEALQQMAEEGVVQVFRPQDGSPAGFPPTIPRRWPSSSPTKGSALPTTSTAIRCFWRATISIWATPASARPASCSPTSRTVTPTRGPPHWLERHRNGLLRNREPASPYRQGNSAALEMPIRTPTAISGFTSRANSWNGGRSSGRPLCVAVTAIAWHSRPGPEQRRRSSNTPRRRRILARPSSGSIARIRTALAEPSGSQTKLRHQWIP